jgi:NDP-sugar pyrophosphorylase family protein
MSGVTTAIVLAGGLGERLRPLTSDRPKPMIVVYHYPLLHHSVVWLRRSGIKQIVISCGYRHEVIQEHFKDGRRFDLKITYSIEEEPLGRGGGIKLASQSLSEVSGPILVINGDMITDLPVKDLADFHTKAQGSITMVTVPLKSPYGIVESDSNNNVVNFREKPTLPYWINAGVYLIEKKILEEFPDKGDHEELLFPRLAQELRLKSFSFNGFWHTIDTAKDLADLQKKLESLKNVRLSERP